MISSQYLLLISLKAAIIALLTIQIQPISPIPQQAVPQAKSDSQPAKPAQARTAPARIAKKSVTPMSWAKLIELDTDLDGQVSIHEWKNAALPIEEFGSLDLNEDGYITESEYQRHIQELGDIILNDGIAKYQGIVTEEPVKRYYDKKCFKIVTIRLLKGITYEFEQSSNHFASVLFLEDADHVLLQPLDLNAQGPRISYTPQFTGLYRLIATSQAGVRTGEFTITVKVIPDPKVAALPDWFRLCDEDQDGQVTLSEWVKAGKNEEEFSKHDLNGDGFITRREWMLESQMSSTLNLNNGSLQYQGTVLEEPIERYQGKKSFKILTIRLVRGRTYQFELSSRHYAPVLFLEDANHNLLQPNADGAQGPRIVYKAELSGEYYLIATSQAGVRTGDFVIAVHEILDPEKARLPEWFRKCDRDDDGQVALSEWLKQGKSEEEFAVHDLNGDGFITVRELMLELDTSNSLSLKKGNLQYRGQVEENPVDRYQGKKSFRILNIKFQKGSSYQIEMTSKEYYSFLYLEDPDNQVVEINNSGGRGATAKILHHATKSGFYRLIATSQDGYKTGEFSLAIREISRGQVAILPSWFQTMDRDGDGQISLFEWRTDSTKPIDQFQLYDTNNDGFITAIEIERVLKAPSVLTLKQGRVDYQGEILEAIRPLYQGKKNYAVLNVRLEKGKIYQFEQVSKEYFAYLYLEDPDQQIVGQHNSGGNGATAHLLHQAHQSGYYRIIATSQAGVKTGPYTLVVKEVDQVDGVVIPQWFRDLDLNGDCQVSLFEWRKGGYSLEEFEIYDINEDGFITSRELVKLLPKSDPGKRVKSSGS